MDREWTDPAPPGRQRRPRPAARPGACQTRVPPHAGHTIADEDKGAQVGPEAALQLVQEKNPAAGQIALNIRRPDAEAELADVPYTYTLLTRIG